MNCHLLYRFVSDSTELSDQFVVVPDRCVYKFGVHICANTQTRICIATLIATICPARLRPASEHDALARTAAL